eukprot:NODE_977_length_1641_cov_75.847990_g806_i0.p2 GENE.NODE_977_length_1641_cov_75.847990_g806_i0~~NODE_977_length_1641_cov_75.847990_g806_i0.p2  ORF type:complete len:481 (+),score=173.12 NODE_977_length_1641_cov_75.847990_g806_i0:117-1559(+)
MFVRSSARLAAHNADVVIVGGGPGGYVAAIKAAQLGLKTVCIEKRGALGGTCLNVGCIPSKALLNATHHYHFMKDESAQFGITGGAAATMDYEKMHGAKDKSVKSLTSGIEFLFKKAGVTYVKDAGRFKEKDTIECEKTGDTYKASKGVVIATGSEPTPLPFIGFDEKVIMSSTGALAIPTPPKHMVVIGGGVIGLEMGSVWARLGSQVTVVEFMSTICPFMDSALVKEFRRMLGKQGMTFKESTKVTAVEKKGDSATLTLEPSKGGDQTTLEADAVLVSVGRRPYTEGLGLDKIGVELDKRGAVVIKDEHWTTSVDKVFAIGDVINKGPMLAHKAEDEGIAIAEMLAGKAGHVNYDAIPSVIYTAPEVAWVGKTEEEVKQEGIKYKTGVFPYAANSRAKTNMDTAGLVKVITEASTDKLLGAHILSSNAGEAIAEFVLGLEYGAAAEDIGRTCHAHPTMSEAIKEACMAAYDKPIHVPA